MICKPCIDDKHDDCEKCPCQHKKTEKLNDGTIAPAGVKRDVR